MSNCTAISRRILESYNYTSILAAFQPREHSLPVQQKERGDLLRCDFLKAKLYLHPLQTNDITEHGTSEAFGDAGEATLV
jgi:hypothetical protein